MPGDRARLGVAPTRPVHTAPDAGEQVRGQNRPMPRLRRVSVSQPGLTRRRSGTGFTYLDAAGKRITEPAVLERCRELVVPPAWEDVWICPYPNGHVQA